MSQLNTIGLTQAEIDERTFISKVYLWMTSALVVTAVVAALVANDFRFVLQMYTSGLVWLFFIGEIALVVVLSRMVGRLSAGVATTIFIGYAALNGVTLSIIFLAYTDASIASAFLVTAGTFGAMSAYGYFTQRDLTTVGNFLVMGLLGFLIASVVNLFLRSEGIYWITTYAGILIFVGLTAYDTQKIKRMASGGMLEGDVAHKASILGALALYLDFINLLLLLLRVMGRRR
jgi:FtsH-binding integral membrane protein